MTLELVKEYNRKGELMYYISVDGKMEIGSIRNTMMDAMETYENIKSKYTQARTEVLVREEI
jgi:hypothetical protein